MENLDALVVDRLRNDPFVADLLRQLLYTEIHKFLDTIEQDVWNELREMVRQLKNFEYNHVQKHINNLDFEPQPNGTRFYYKDEYSEILVIEQEPMVRSVNFLDIFEGDIGNKGYLEANLDRAKGKSYRLAFPYMVFIIRFSQRAFHSLYVAYNKKPLSSLDDQLCVSNLPNTRAASGVCMGVPQLPLFDDKSSLSDRAEYVLSHFWQSTFNFDYTEEYRAMACSDLRFRTILDWQENSKLNPFFVLKVDWNDFATLREIIGNYLINGFLSVQHNVQIKVQECTLAIKRIVSDRLRNYQSSNLKDEKWRFVIREKLNRIREEIRNNT